MASQRVGIRRRRSVGRAPAGRRPRDDRPPRLVLLACGGVFLAAAVGALTRPDPVAPPGPVLLVGDSLFFQASEELQATLGADGWQVTTVAEPGAGLAGGGYGDVDWSELLPAVVTYTKPRIVVVELGTNRCGRGCDTRAHAIDDIMHTLADIDTVLWLNVRTDSGHPPDAADINEDLEDAASTFVNLELLPYDDWLDGHPGTVTDDGVHLTTEGQQLMADRVRDALRDHSSLAG